MTVFFFEAGAPATLIAELASMYLYSIPIYVYASIYIYIYTCKSVNNVIKSVTNVIPLSQAGAPATLIAGVLVATVGYALASHMFEEE